MQMNGITLSFYQGSSLGPLLYTWHSRHRQAARLDYLFLLLYSSCHMWHEQSLRHGAFGTGETHFMNSVISRMLEIRPLTMLTRCLYKWGGLLKAVLCGCWCGRPARCTAGLSAPTHCHWSENYSRIYSATVANYSAKNTLIIDNSSGGSALRLGCFCEQLSLQTVCLRRQVPLVR